MIRSKRLLAVGLVAALGLAAAACGGDDDDDSERHDRRCDGADDGDRRPRPRPRATTDDHGGHRRPADDAPRAAAGDDTTPEGTAAPAVENPKVGLLYDVTGRGDRSFNDAAAAGLDAAKASVGAVGTESTPTSDGDRAERLAGLLGAGPRPTSSASASCGARRSQAAAVDNPDQKFGLIDSVAMDTKGTPDDFADDDVAARTSSR